MNSPKLKSLSKAYSRFTELTVKILPTDNCCESCLWWIQKCTAIILRLFTEDGFQYLLYGTNWQAICLQASYHFYKKFSHEFQKWKLSYVNYRFCVNQSSLKYLNLFQENSPFSDIHVSSCLYTLHYGLARGHWYKIFYFLFNQPKVPPNSSKLPPRPEDYRNASIMKIETFCHM